MGRESRQTRTGPYSEASIQKQPARQVKPEAAQKLDGRKDSLKQGRRNHVVQREQLPLPVLARMLCTRVVWGSGVGEWTRVQGHQGRPRGRRDAGALEDGQWSAW